MIEGLPLPGNTAAWAASIASRHCPNDSSPDLTSQRYAVAPHMEWNCVASGRSASHHRRHCPQFSARGTIASRIAGALEPAASHRGSEREVSGMQSAWRLQRKVHAGPAVGRGLTFLRMTPAAFIASVHECDASGHRLHRPTQEVSPCHAYAYSVSRFF
jgi:hypothetical protein